MQPDTIDIVFKIFQYNYGDNNTNNLQFIKENINNTLTPEDIATNQKLFDIAALLYIVTKHDKHLSRIIQGSSFEYIKSIYFLQLRRCLIQYDQLSLILKELYHVDCQVMLLKGFALSEIIYNSFAVRPMSDIDLFVQKRHFIQAEEVITNLGFKKIINPKFSGPIAEHAFHTQFSKKVNNLQIMLELHYGLSNDAHSFNTASIWIHAQQHTFEGSNALVMEPHDLLVYLSLHAARHNFKRLLWLCDIAQVIKVYHDVLDWETLVNRSYESKSNIALFYSLKLIQGCLHIRIPDKWNLNDLSVPRLSRFWLNKFLLDHIKEISCSAYSSDSESFVTRLMIAPGIAGKMHIVKYYIQLLIFRNPDDLQNRYKVGNNIIMARIAFPFLILYKTIAELFNRQSKR